MATDSARNLQRGTGVAIYVIDGRVLIRTIDSDGGAPAPRTASASIVEDFGNVEAEQIGAAVLGAARDAQRLEESTQPRASEYNASLLAETDGKYKSFRTWQRAVRHVNAAVHADRWQLTRLHPDLKGGWTTARASDPAHADYPQRFDLQLYADADELGDAVMQLLAEPSLRENIGH